MPVGGRPRGADAAMDGRPTGSIVVDVHITSAVVATADLM
jgi:hypothetical protein